MCEQCVAKARKVAESVLPGFYLMQAEGGSADWPKGWYGLGQVNDPWIVFPLLAPDPTFEFSDDQLDALKEFPPGDAEYWKAVEAFREHYNMPPSAGYDLVLACIASGYSAEKHGPNVECWLVHYLATAVAVQSATIEPAATIKAPADMAQVCGND